ncbi:unnamed protein product [Candida verbasci]|uniref:Arrestin C-terminal-like domain-containing protein n=1 Tax=Candida verbasci TaxID=1227364 RepID=A0A9W4TVM6_9ASCO|nr:unnamed protein product [Candida verbasci]
MHFHLNRIRRHSTESDSKPNNISSTASRLRSSSLSTIRNVRSNSKSNGSHNSTTLSPNHHSDHNSNNQNYSICQFLHDLNILENLGLQKPIPIKTTTQGSLSKTIKMYVSNSNNCIYLPPASSTSFTYEDVENGGIISTDEQPAPPAPPAPPPPSPPPNSTDVITSTSTSASTATNSSNNSQISAPPTSSPMLLSTKIDSDHPIPHLFAVMIEVQKESTIQSILIKFQSVTQILWPSGDIYNKGHSKEKFKIGSLQWETNLSEADYYINYLGELKTKSKLNPGDLAKRTRDYKLLDDSSTTKTKAVQEQVYKAGLYIFLLPILLPDNIPPSISSINGSLSHNLQVNFNKISDKLNRKLKVNSSYNLPMVRIPPNYSNSVGDKPIYVNRVWNDSIHYIITFPRKYISLGSEHVINVKLVPLVKDVIVKRIKFNVLERITYISKDLSKEYDYDSEEPYSLHSKDSNKIRERIVSLCELKTKHKQSSSNLNDPYKEEIIRCPDNNLLYSCYEQESDLSKHKKQNNKSMIASPLDINIALPFLTTKNDKDIDEPILSPTNSRKASIMNESSPSSPIIGALETNLSNVDEIGLHELKRDSSNYLTDDLTSKHSPPENIQQGYTILNRALYPDSNYRHIQINHRLQVCFRISKPDPKDDFKMHHYEVVVDTPLILLSSKCNDQNIQLPKYDEINGFTTPTFRIPNFKSSGIEVKPWIVENELIDDDLPTFEQATSSEDSISRIPSISSAHDPVPPPTYESNAMINGGSLNSSNIDEIVQGGHLSTTPSSNNVYKPQRKDSIRESLSSSFARTNNANSISNNANSSHPFESNSLSDEVSSIQSNYDETTPPSSTIPDSTSISSSNNSSIEQYQNKPKKNNDVIDEEDDDNENAIIDDEEDTENAIIDDEEEEEEDDDDEDDADEDEVGSLITQDINVGGFDQRIPLLHHVSSDTIKTFNPRISTEDLIPQNQRTFIN